MSIWPKPNPSDHGAQAERRPVARSSARRVALDASRLLRGELAGAGLMLATSVVVARHLGTSEFGVLAMAQMYALTVRSLVTIESYQVVVRFGVQAIERGSRSDFGSVVRSSVRLDLASAAAGTAVAVSGAVAVGLWSDWSTSSIVSAVLFSLAILPTATDAWTGILRTFGRFSLLGVHVASLAAVRLLLIGLLVVANQGLVELVVAWVAVDVVGGGALIVLGALELRRQGRLGDVIRAKRLEGTLQSEFRAFTASTYLHSSMRTVSRSADTLVVGAVGSPSVAGVYRIAKQMASIPSRATDPFSHSVYPELSRLWARGQHSQFWLLVRRMSIAGAAAGVLMLLGFAVAGRPVITALLGAEYAAAYGTTLVMLVGIATALACIALHPAALAIGAARESVIAMGVSTVAYLAVLPVLTAAFGSIGAGVAYVVLCVVWGVVLGAVVTNLRSKSDSDA